MSIEAIKKYKRELAKTIRHGGSTNETSIRSSFLNLLNEYARPKGFLVVPELHLAKNNKRPDGTLTDSLTLTIGHWESKDKKDNLDNEIEKKFKDAGYPKENIIFENSEIAVLFQNGSEVQRVNIEDESQEEKLHQLLTAFVSFERAEINEFRTAIEKFREDIPTVTKTLQQSIENAEKTNKDFIEKSKKFLELCKNSINPEVSMGDVKEMIIQHILTEDIFNTIFDETQFHRENNIAKTLESVIDTFFTGSTKRNAFNNIEYYYKTIKAAAAKISNHYEKQKFLKIVYENFYKSYNPKASDRLGVVYTPHEIVRFMIESADHLLNKHFNKSLEDRNVEILDPATGTGTFVCDIIDYIENIDKLAYKYEHEIHANEVAILPYYISNLNIEYTYKQKTEKYKEFENLCFVDTLDNMGFDYVGKQTDVFAPLSEENKRRIKNQNDKKIAVIIGNPPYNANQLNENDNNKNREYKEIDRRIKNTFVKESTAQKTKVYDMYARFYRWAFDRLDENGIVAFITNRSFIDSRTFDGFRKTIQKEFDYAYIIDTKSDVRANPKISGTGHNVFGIQTGVAIMFLVKKEPNNKEPKAPCEIQYTALDDFMKREDKLQWLSEHSLNKLSLERIRPDKNNNWINLAENNDWESLLPIADKNVKLGKNEKALFSLYSLGVVTSRDEWSYDFSVQSLIEKIKFFCSFFENEKKRWKASDKKIKSNQFVDRTIKFGEELVNHLTKGSKLVYKKEFVRQVLYRPFIKKYAYIDRIISHRLYKLENIVGVKKQYDNNIFISITFHDQLHYPSILSGKIIWDYCFGGRDSTGIPLYRYNSEGQRIDNITTWGSNRFAEQYPDEVITKEDIFHYVYAVLHNPAYRSKYEINLKRDFPRIPFYENFRKWANWGKILMQLHIDYESVTPYELKEVVTGTDTTPRTKLKADKETNVILIDDNTELNNIPKEAWQYKLGNRSALEWILDQYKESKPKDETIAEKFNTYKFADYKAQVIDLLKRVCTVSVDTIKILKEMEEEN